MHKQFGEFKKKGWASRAGAVLKRERVGGEKKEREILLHKEQVWSLQRGWRRTCSVASAGRRWLPLYHNSGLSLDTKNQNPGTNAGGREVLGTKRLRSEKSMEGKNTGAIILLLVQDGVWARRAHVHGHERAKIICDKRFGIRPDATCVRYHSPYDASSMQSNQGAHMHDYRVVIIL